MLEKIKHAGAWLNENQDLGLDLVRVYLGIGLLVRGMLFIGDPSIRLQEMLAGPEPAFATAMVMHYVVLAHIAGGLMLTLGLLTRVAAAIQIPILFGAVFFLHIEEGLLGVGQSLEFSALVLFLLVVFAIFGSGRWSADYYIFHNEDGRSFDDMVPAPSIDEADFPTPANVDTEPRERTLRKSELAFGASERISETCSCGHDITHDKVTIEPKYGLLAGFRFFMGISAPVKRIDFWCSECGEVIERSRQPEVLEKYRWHST